MIVKFFKYGSGDGKSAFDYLLNYRVEDGTSRVLRGNADLTLSIIQSLTTNKKYKSGCLSFEEENIAAIQKEEIMDLFEETIFPGIEKENRNIVWIEHTDKQRLELNFVIPRVELSTFKSFNPYYHKAHKKRFSLFRDYVNTTYKLSDPMDPKKVQTLQLGEMAKYSKNEQVEKLDAYLLSLIQRNALKNRDELIYELKSIGYEITRMGEEYISIKAGNSKAIRLKGKYYRQNWNDEEFTKSSGSKSIFKALEKAIEKAKQYNQKLFYKKKQKPVKKINTMTKGVKPMLQENNS